MKPEFIDRKRLKSEMKETLRTAQVSPRAMTALYLGLSLVLTLINYLGGGQIGALSVFLSILTRLLSMVLGVGFVLYCMAVMHGERAEFLCLFDGFSFAGKVILLSLVQMVFIMLWSMLFLVPGIIAAYRYRFAEYNLCENPTLGVFEALELSKRQTMGYKLQLFTLDLSYFGWACLAALPVMAESFLYSYEAAAVQLGTPAFLPVLSDGQYPLWLVVTGVWQIGVSIFYLSAYQCTELGYYEIAKATSNLYPDRWTQTPDGL